MEHIIERLFRRIQMLAGRGRVTQVDDSGPVQTMQVQASGLELADKRARPQEFGLTSNPPTGSDAALLALAGDRTAVMVVGVNHQPSRPRNLSPGETKLYSQDGKYVYLTASGGIVVDANGQDVVVNNAKDVTWNLSGKLKFVAPGGVEFVTPLVASTGDIQDNTGSNDKTMAGMREIYDIHTHPVRNVQSGGSTVTSDAPSQQQ
ncbi:phage baseplate assembly protein V [Bordetella bronchialis]|uniref:Baseplate assembly protein n=1 Tax=Bordetella bronchialis TaxID=463025 RepID=A0A193FTF5_9BORD|nr:phage baseplate assembly protein V [Bordetella bronchialis]ANN70920.1 baseplate assembly protein [Bordetella bronchialis]